MGARTDCEIREWQKAAGLALPSAGELKKIAHMKTLAFDLVKCLVLEEGGIRDGAGFWVGSDPIDGIIRELYESWK